MSALRWLVACLASSLVVSVGVAVDAGTTAASGGSISSLGSGEIGGAVSSAGLLEIPGAQFLFGQEQALAQREVDRFNPIRGLERKASRTRFEHLSPARAAFLSGQAFPDVVNQTAGGPPPLGAGERIVGYPSDHTAQIVLPGGKHGVVDSAQPIAREIGSGKHTPIDLSLEDVRNGFQPRVNDLTVDIPKRLQDGVSLPGIGVSLTPLDVSGQVVAGNDGSVDGSTVFYGDTGNDTDALVKPTTSGFEEDTVLLSASSPDKLGFKVGVPAGAHLLRSREGGVQVLDAGRTIAQIPAPTARDAEGTAVPVSTSLSHGTLALTVEVDKGMHADGGYRYPIIVDPWVIDKTFSNDPELLNWLGETDNPSAFAFPGISEIRYVSGSTYKAGDYGLYRYTTQKESHIFAFVMKYASSGSRATQDFIVIGKPGHNEGEEILANEAAPYVERTVCAEGSCAAKSVTSANEENGAYFAVSALEEGKEFFNAHFTEPAVYIEQDKGPSASVDTTDSELNGQPNAGSGRWVTTVGKTPAVLGVNAFDPGTGVNAVGMKSGTWGYAPEENRESECAGGFKAVTSPVQCNECFESTCAATGEHSKPFALPFANLGLLPEGEDFVEATVKDAVGLSATTTAVVKVDNAAPHNITLTGLPSELAAGEYHLKGEATDGTTGGLMSSGMKSLALLIDGREIGSPSGSCKVEKGGPCTVSAEWTIAGRTFAVGNHVATLVATDNAGNVETTETVFKVNSAAQAAVGPGSVNLASGEFGLTATDVSLGGGLTVGRTYGSRHAGMFVGGLYGVPVGHSWGLTLGGHQTLVMQPNESMVLSGSGGSEAIFAKKGSTFESPSGNKNLKLIFQEKTGVKEYVLKNEATATSTTFEQPSKSGEVWVPAIQKGPVATETVSYSYESDIFGTRPTEALAPVPAGVSCSPELKPGCRALTFVYGGLGSPGENESEWGEYFVHLKEIVFWAYNPVSKEMQKTPVAQYQYDKQGRLRAEWDPRISPALKTIYGYDAENHVTSLSAPGEEPWLFTYGTITNDSSAGRLLKAAQAPAATALWAGINPAVTENPKITGSPYVGVRLAVSSGKWSGSPVAYSYSWEDCNSAGAECTVIPGANNANYTPASNDVGHTIVAQVTALSGGDAAAALTTATSEIKNTISEIALPAGSLPSGVTLGPDNNMWFTEPGTSKVAKVGSSGLVTGEYATEANEPLGITSGADGNLWFVEHSFRNVDRMTTGGEKTVHTLTRSGTYNVGIASGADKNLWFTESETGYIGKINTALEVLGEYALPTGSKPYGITAGPESSLWFTDYGTGFIGKITTAGAITEYKLPAGSEPSAIAAGPEGNVWFTDYGTGFIGKVTTAGVVTEYKLPAGSQPSGIVAGADKNLWFTERGTSRIGRITASGAITEYALPSGSQPYGIAAGPNSNLWYADYGTSKIGKIFVGATEGEHRSPEAGYTIEYGTPLSGSGLPSMTEAEVKKWGETDLPLEATAILPADKPQEWPATSYSGSTIFYLDGKGHLVNMKNRAGGISTSEYNATNDVVRALSPDNREAALKEGAKSVEVAKLLDSQSTYNSEGTELESALGPRHLVKLSNGKEVQARSHSVYSYDEGAPAEGGPYRLVTKMTSGAQTEAEGEQDVRTTTTSYSGQSNLGWRLRQPTSAIADPSGLHLTRKTVYDETSGNVLESVMPLGAGENASPAFLQQVGVEGVGNGQLKNPKGMAIDLKGNIWVADDSNSRLEEFTSSGEYVATLGSFGSGNGQFNSPKGVAIDSKGNMWVVDSVNNRIQEFTEKAGKYEYLRQVGSLGSETGKFNEPKGIAVDSHNNVWVTDSKNNRIEEFSETGTYLKVVGKAGFGNGELSEPRNAVVDSKGNIWVGDTNNNRVEEFNEKGEYVRKFGTTGSGNGQLDGPQGIAVDAKGNVWIVDTQNNRVEEFSESGTYLTQFGTGGTGIAQMTEPRGIMLDAKSNVWVADTNNGRLEKWASNSEGPHTTQTVYYSVASNSKYPGCGLHPEWVNLTCLTRPAKQPETAGLPALAETTYSKYNVWGEPETVTEVFGSTTRTTTVKYDSAGRVLSSSVSSTVGTALPTVNYKYDGKLGTLSEESTTVEAKTQSLKSTFNTLGETTSYTDANGTISTYEYEKEGDGRLMSSNDGKGTQSYTYDETTGGLVTLKDTAAAAFVLTATYDSEANLLTESYPNGMTASYTYNQVGAPASVEYEKKTHCTEKCVWFKDSVVPTVHGQWATQTSTQATNRYSYDAAGRLTQVQDEPVGKGCTTRVYAYDEDTNRTSSTTRAPGGAGECTTTGGTTETHPYDQADRLLDSGATYDAFGDTTTLPAGDAGGSSLESSFYTDDQLASQTQAEETIGYKLDPAGRVGETVATGKVVGTVVNHYAGAGEEPSWTSEPSGSTTRDIGGIGGLLVATQNNVESPVLQIANLHGDIVATASMSETATGLASTVAEASEYGVPGTTTPAKYSWLGANELATQLVSGVVNMGARSYVPQLGRFLQTDPVPGGSANAYAYTYGDPVGASDLSGEYTETQNSADSEFIGEIAMAAAERRAAENAAAQAEAERIEAEEAAERAEVAASEVEVAQEARERRYSGGGGRGGDRAVVASAHYNACLGHPDPHDHSERCCYKGSPVTAHTPNGAHVAPCDVRPAPKCHEQGCAPAYERKTPLLNCPDGTFPAVSYLTGAASCVPDGDDSPQLEAE